MVIVHDCSHEFDRLPNKHVQQTGANQTISKTYVPYIPGMSLQTRNFQNHFVTVEAVDRPLDKKSPIEKQKGRGTTDSLEPLAFKRLRRLISPGGFCCK